MRIVLIGGGGHASDVLGVIEELQRQTMRHAAEEDEVIGILADGEIDDSRFRDRDVKQIGGIDDLPKIEATHFVIAVGYSRGRKAVFDRLDTSRVKALTLIHPRAYVPRNVTVGAGTVILAGVCISPLACIGDHAYLSHGCLIGHDCRIEDFATVLPGAAISGDTLLSEGCMIGSKACVLEKRRVGAWATVGAGAVVTKDVPRGVTVMGVPAH